MPGRRDRNFLSGDLNEDACLLMLRELAAVAPFRRQDDFGVDAMCTLYREAGRDLLPEDSFAVQIKSSSVRELELTGQQLAWLRIVDLPMFHVLFDRKTGSAEFYSYEWVHPHEFKERTTLTVDITPAERAALRKSTAGALSSSPPRVWLGPPILTLSVADLADAGYRQSRYELFKGWCKATSRIIRARHHHVYPLLDWTTNSLPSQGVRITRTEGTAQERAAALEEMMPYLAKLSLALRHTSHGLPGRGTNQELFREVQAIGWYAKRLSVEPDFPLLYHQTTDPSEGDGQDP